MNVALGLGCALVAGGVLGLERTFHGRAAGFRTHALVALASAAVVMTRFTGLDGLDGINPGDPSRLVQGTMTGVGFLGAGVIFKEGVSVQGLTTAASVWITAAIGLLFGLGDYAPAWLTVVGALCILVVLRWMEERLPSQILAKAVLRFEAAKAPDEPALRAFLKAKRIQLRDTSYGQLERGSVIEFSGIVSSGRAVAFADLASDLKGLTGLLEFQLDRISK